MISKWFHLKPKAIYLREKGYSIVRIESMLGIPKSTLSGWLKTIVLTSRQKKSLKDNSCKALVLARKKAVVWHNKQKILRFKKAEDEANGVVRTLNLEDKSILELALSMLYLGEGFKTSSTGIGNSDPLILKFFLKLMTSIYNLDVGQMRFDLHLRYDQKPLILKKYWSRQLKVPIERFKYVALDQRTKGRKTYSNYKGVCLINCGNVAIQRKLVYLSKKFCEKILSNKRT